MFQHGATTRGIGGPLLQEAPPGKMVARAPRPTASSWRRLLGLQVVQIMPSRCGPAGQYSWRNTSPCHTVCPEASSLRVGGLGHALHAAGTQEDRAAVPRDLAEGTSSSPARRTEGFPFWDPGACQVLCPRNPALGSTTNSLLAFLAISSGCL